MLDLLFYLNNKKFRFRQILDKKIRNPIDLIFNTSINQTFISVDVDTSTLAMELLAISSVIT